MVPLPKSSGNAQGSGTSTPPSTEMGTLREEELLTIGALYWVEDDRDDEVWATAEALDQCEGHVMVQMVDSGERKEIDLDLEEMFPKNPSVVADMTALHHIHEPGILHNLKERSRPWRQTPYTFMGTILLAVNPLKAVPMPPVEEFMDQPLDPEMPHPYAIAELAYRQMRLAGGRAGTNQSIVVSGESGAGKTETVKIILSYLTRRSKGADEDLEGRVLESSPLLESFGNARTLRNDNSSRFGKFLKLRFTSGESSYLLGASVEPYLLEKSRVLAQGDGERNFHILYELVAGALQSDLGKKLKLKRAREYRVLSSSGCIALEGVDDADRFKAIQDAFTTVGVDSDAQLQVWQALAGVLHMSELEIEEADHEEGPVAAISDRETLSTVADMLGIEAQKLEEMFTLKIVPVTRGEVFTKRLGKMEAIRGRGAVVKSLYEAMFLWVVRAINIALGGTTKVAGDDKLPFIGLLDIFGFENFGHKNNLEQLLINYANESLQADFNRQVFENELRVYAEEGIEVSVSNARYSSSCLRMLTAKRDGVLPILDDVCSQPLPSDKRYLERLHVAFSTRQGQSMDVAEKAGTRDVSSRSSVGSDADDASAATSPGIGRKSSEMMGVRGYWAGTEDDGTGAGMGGRRTSAGSGSSRKWDKLDKGGSEVGESSTHSNDDAVTEIMSLEWLGRGGALADDFRTEEHESFWVNHYASKVLYTVDGWVERNMDSVPQSFSETMLTSTHAVVLDATTEFLSDRMPEKDKRTTVDAPIPRKTTVRRDLKSALGRRTVAGNFMASMNNLSTTLAATTCNFIRCVKPNAAMDFGIFDSQYVVEQLRCLGVLRTCEVLKLGMPTRVSYADMKQSLGEGTLEAEKLFEGEPEKSLVAAILWAFDVPSEVFRLGAKRVFFRAGQIAVLHRILNETPADKVPWVLSRLRLALANRRMAKIAAEEAEDSLAEAEAAVMEAEAVSSDTGNSGGNSDKSPKTPLSPGSSADADMRALVATVDKARRAARNAAQVKAIVKSAEVEGIGKHAPGAAEKIKASSSAALADISKAAARSDELEKLTTLGVFGMDGSARGETEMTSLRELHVAMRGIRDGLAEARRHWKSAEESADKCQSNPAVESAKQAKEKATEVVQKATQVSENSKKAIDVARRQRRAKDVTTRATERALKSFRSFQVVARQATLDEKRCRENPSLSAEAAEAAAAAVAAAPSSGGSPAPGSGLIQAAKAALAGALAYESLTEDQKQQRLAEQRAASAEAAIAIAEAAKEEEQKRLELAALERERLQELEEEAAAAVAEEGKEGLGGRDETPLRLTVVSAKDTPMSEKAKTTAGAEGVEAASLEGRDSSRPPPVRSFLAARKAGAGGSPRASDPSSGSGVVLGRASSRSRTLERQNSGGSAMEAAAAATAAVEAVTGMKSFTPRGAKEAVAREEAAAEAAAAAGTPAVNGDSEKMATGRAELPESRVKAAEAQAKAMHAKAKALEAQEKAAKAHRKAAEAHLKAAEATGPQLGTSTTIITGWGENGDQLGPGSIKARLGAFTSANSKDTSASEPPVNGHPHGGIGATALGSRSGRFQAGVVEGETAKVESLVADGSHASAPALVSTRSSRLEDVSSVDAENRVSVTGEVVLASKIGAGSFSRSTTSSLSPVPESAEEASASGISFGVPVASADGRGAMRWVGADNDRDGPASVEDGLEAFSGTNPAFAYGDKIEAPGTRPRPAKGETEVDIGGTDDSEIRGLQSCGWGENGEQTAPGSIKDRLGGFSGKGSRVSVSEVGGKVGTPSGDDESTPFRRTVSGRKVTAEASAGGVQAKSGWDENGDQSAPGSIRRRLGAFSGKKDAVPLASGNDGSTSHYRRGVPGSNGDATPPDGDESSTNRGAVSLSGRNGAEAFFASRADGGTASGWGVNGDLSAPGSIKERLSTYSGNGNCGASASGAVSADASAVANTFCAVGVKLGNGDIGGSDHSSLKQSEGSSELSSAGVGAAATARRGVNGEGTASGWGENGVQSAPGSVKGRLTAFPRKSGASSATQRSEDGSSAPQTVGAYGEGVEGEGEDEVSFEERERRPQTSGWGEGGDQGAPGSIKDRLGMFTSRGIGSGVIDNDGKGYTSAPARSPPSLERGASQASASASEGTDELVSIDDQRDNNGDHTRDLPSVRARVAAFSGKGPRVPRISKISSPGSRSPPYRRDAEAGASAGGATESEGSVAGEEEQVSRDGNQPARSTASGWGESGDKSAPGSVKDRLSALSGNKASHQGSRSPRPGGVAASMEGVVGTRVGLGSRSGSYESPTDDGRQKHANTSPWSASVDRSPSGSFKERLAAFSNGSNSSGSSGNGSGIKNKGDMRTRFGPASGTRSPSFKGDRSGGGGSGASSPASGGDHFKAAFGGRSPTYRRDGGFSKVAGSSGDSKSLSSPDKPRSRKEEAIAALAAAEAAAAREEEQWTRKMKTVEEERRRAREERMKAAAEVAAIEEEEGGGGRGSGARRHELESKQHAFDDHDYAEGDEKQGFGGDSDGGMGGTRLRRRSMKKSGFPYGGGGGGGVGDGSREIEGISEEEGEEGDEMRPWPEAGGDDEEGETMEAKKPMTGNRWQTAPGLSPWRSPERAPEYGNKSNDAFEKVGYTRSASFAGDPSRARNSSWNRMGASRSSGIMKNHSMAGDLGHQEEAMVSWEADPKKGEEGGEGGDVNGKGPVILESMLFKDDAKEVGIVEARVMSINSENKSGKPPRRAPKWNQYYFRLREGVLTKSPARRSTTPGKVQKSEDMELSSETITSYTNTKNCFCVRTGKVSWFLLGRSLADMKRWMHAINLQVRYVFQKEHGVHDDYQGQGRHGRFFYRMIECSVPQWILTHPMPKAPRTGEGLFPGEVIEVTQVLGSGGSTFLRLSNDRGWTFARSPTDGSVLFEDLAGSVSEDTSTYSFPTGALGIVPILHGPGLRTQATGVTILAGERVQASERFTPVDGTSVVFIKLKDGRGWVPVKNNDYAAPLNVLEGW